MVGDGLCQRICAFRSPSGYCGKTGACVLSNATQRTQRVKSVGDAVEVVRCYNECKGEWHDIEVKRGRWIGKHINGFLSHPDSITYTCSECGYSFYTVYGIPWITKYCPNCGAKMDLEEEDGAKR